MPNWNGAKLPEPGSIKIPDSLPKNFNWNSYLADPKGTFNKFKGAREVNRLNWKGYNTAVRSTKNIIASSPSKRFISSAGKQIRTLKRTTDTANKVAKESKSLWDNLLSKIKGGNQASKASGLSNSLGAFIAIGGVAIIVALQAKVSEFVQGQQEKTTDTLSKDLTKANELAVRANLSIKEINSKIAEINRQRDKFNAEIAGNVQNTTKARETANNALYEVRQGRAIVEGKIEAAKKIANDALYETRQGRKIVEEKIQTQATSFNQQISRINSQIANFGKGVNENFQNSVNATIQKVQADIALTKAAVSNIKQAPPVNPVDVNAIIASAKSAATQEVNSLKNQVSALGNTINGLIGRFTGVEITIPVVTGAVSNLANGQKQLDDKFNSYVQQNNRDLGIRDLNTSNLSKEFDKKLADFERQSGLTSEQRFAEFTRQNNEALKIRDLNTSNLSNEFDRKIADFKRLSNLDSNQRFEEFQRQNREAIGTIEKDLSKTSGDLGKVKADLTKIDTGLREQEKMNEEGNRKLDSMIPMLAGIPLIVGRAEQNIIRNTPTIPQIENAAATGTCRTTQPGGCMNKALNDNANQINTNTNNKVRDALDAVNTGANAALLAGQQTILTRLGAQLPGGIGGKLSRFADWMHLDRVLNILILAATIHNALMLSNDIGQTLIGAINNVLQLIGLKKEDGSTFDIGSVISGSIENIIKGAIGADNYVELKEAWAKANRIYQATNNVINSFLNLSQTILQASELIAAYTGRIGNALRKGGVILESAYGWMNPQPKFNRVTGFLEKFQNGASTIQMVTQAPLDIVNATTELTTASTDFVKAIKEDNKPENKPAPTPEPDELKAKEQASKTDSQPLNFDFSDLFDGED